MRIAAVLILGLILGSTTAFAKVRVEVRAGDRGRDSRIGYGLDWGFGSDLFETPLSGFSERAYYGDASRLGSPWHYRRANPRLGLGGRSGYGYGGYGQDNCLDTFNPYSYYRPGAYTILQYPDYSFYHGPGYSPYGAPAYVYPGGGTLVIDGDPYAGYPGHDAPLPPQYRQDQPAPVYNDNRVYDNSVTNNYYAPPGSPTNEPVAAASSRREAQNGGKMPPPQNDSSSVQPVGPQVPEGYAPAPAVDAPQVQPPAGRPYGTRFYGQVRVGEGDSSYQFQLNAAGELKAGRGEKMTLLSKGVDPAFGGFAVYQPGIGVSVIFKRAGQIAAAYPADGKWWVEALPRDVDFSTAPSIGMVSGEPWVTVTGADGTRYVIALSSRHWAEIGSGTSSSR